MEAKAFLLEILALLVPKMQGLLIKTLNAAQSGKSILAILDNKLLLKALNLGDGETNFSDYVTSLFNKGIQSVYTEIVNMPDALAEDFLIGISNELLPYVQKLYVLTDKLIAKRAKMLTDGATTASQ